MGGFAQRDGGAPAGSAGEARAPGAATGWIRHLPGVRCLHFAFEAVGPVAGAQLFAVDAGGDVEAALDTDRIEFLFQGSTAVDWAFEGRNRSATVAAGAITTLPASDRHHFRFRGRTLALNLVLRRDFLADLADEFEGWRGPSGLPPALALANPRLLRIGAALRDELAAPGAGSGLFLDGLFTALGVEIARMLSGREPLEDTPTCGAPRIDRVLAYVEDNLGSPIGLDDLATVAGLSRSHLVRDFRRLTGRTPHQYVLARRVERGKALLRDGRVPIADVAYRLGFSSQSHFTTVFRGATGLTPAAFRAMLR